MAISQRQSSPLSETLSREHPQSVRNLAIMCGSGFFWRPWGELREAVRTGRPAFDHVHGASFFEYLAAHSDDAAIFNGAMTSFSSAGLSGMIVAAYDFSRFERIVDVGGGRCAALCDPFGEPQTARCPRRLGLKLTRFRGARQAFKGGFSDAQDATALFT